MSIIVIIIVLWNLFTSNSDIFSRSSVKTQKIRPAHLGSSIVEKECAWHILAPRAVAYDNLHLRASAHL